MNYHKHYNLLVGKAKLEKRKKGDTYYEEHHIIPRSEGGDESENNKVLLTAREHYIAHWLLFRENPTQARACAFWRMTTKHSHYASSRAYEEARTKHAMYMSKLKSGVPRSPKTLKKMEEWRNEALKEGVHPFQNPKSDSWKKTHVQRQLKLVEEGKHNFNSENTRKWAMSRVEKGTHHFLSSDFNKKPFDLYLNGAFIGRFESKVEAVKKGIKPHIIDKLRKEGSILIQRGSYSKTGNKLFTFKKNDILEYKSF